MIRVLQISDSLKKRFGITIFLMNYFRAIDKSKVVFDFLVYDCEKEILDEINSYGGNVYYMPKLSIKNVNCFKKNIRDFLKKHDYPVIHSHFYQIDSIVSKEAFATGTKHFISHSHNTKYSDYWFRSVRNFIMSIPIKYKSTDFCACSLDAGLFLFKKKQLAKRKKKIVVIPNAIDYQKFLFNSQTRLNVRNYYGIKEDSIVIGNVGSLKPQKNHLFLIDVFAHFKSICPNSYLMLVGDGQLKQALTERVRKLGLNDSVIFCGETNNSSSFYNAFDIYAFPSKYEGFGLSLLEAQVNGLPCIASEFVPDEPFVSPIAIKYKLSSGPHCWAKKLKEQVLQRVDPTFISDKYDILKQAMFLTDYYEELYSD